MPHLRHISLQPLLRVHAQLDDLAASALFVGPCVRDTLLDDPELPRPSPASSVVGLTWPIESAFGFTALVARLTELGFVWRGDPEHAERWQFEELEVELTPPDPALRGFVSVWHSSALASPRIVDSERGVLRLVDAPHFCALALETLAVSARKLRRATLSDLLLVVDGCSALGEGIETAPPALRSFVADHCAHLLTLDELPGLLAELLSPAALPSVRAQTALERLRAMAHGGDARAAIPTPLAAPQVSTPVSWQPEHSGAIAKVTYDRTTETLVVEFKRGPIYEYTGVPPLVHAAWRNAASVGNYHNQFIRDCYACRRLA